MSGLNLKTATGSDLRRLQDRLATLRDKETPTDRENRLRTERAQQAQQAATTEALYQTNTAALRDEDMERTKQHKRATKLIEKINPKVIVFNCKSFNKAKLEILKQLLEKYPLSEEAEKYHRLNMR